MLPFENEKLRIYFLQVYKSPIKVIKLIDGKTIIFVNE